MAEQRLTPQQQEWAERMDAWNWKWRLPYHAPVREPGTAGGRTYGYGARSVFGAGGGVTLPAPVEDPGLVPAGDEPGSVEPAMPAVDPLEEVVLVPLEGEGEAQASRTHEVRKGDTLSSISLQYYGKSTLWRRIYDANRARIDSPDRLTVGVQLEIPPAE
jgi:nucleoid-associated protein YgaU